MADGDDVLTAVGTTGGSGAVLVLRVNAATGEPVASILLEDAGGQVPRCALMILDRLAEGLLVEAGGAAPRRDLIPIRRLPGRALLPDAGAAVLRDGLLARNHLPELLLIDAAPIHYEGLLDADVAPPRGYFVADDHVRAAIRLVGACAGSARSYVVGNDRLLGALVFDAGSAARRRSDLLVFAEALDLLAAPDGPRGLHSNSALFLGAVIAALGSSADVSAAAEAQVQHRVLLAAFGGDRRHFHVVELQLLGAAGEHRINVLVAVERQGALAATQRAAALAATQHAAAHDFWDIAGAKDGHHDDLLFEAPDEPLAVGTNGLGTASIDAADGDHRDEHAARVDELQDRIVVRVFDGVHGRLIAATYDQMFGRALLAALAPSRGAEGDTGTLRVFLEVEVLGRGISITGARGQLSASPSTRSNGEGPVVGSLGLPHGASSPAPSPPSFPSPLDSELAEALKSLRSEVSQLGASPVRRNASC